MDFSVEVHEHGNMFPLLLSMKMFCLFSAKWNNGPIQSQGKTDFQGPWEQTLQQTRILMSLCMGGITPNTGEVGRKRRHPWGTVIAGHLQAC